MVTSLLATYGTVALHLRHMTRRDVFAYHRGRIVARQPVHA